LFVSKVHDLEVGRLPDTHKHEHDAILALSPKVFYLKQRIRVADGVDARRFARLSVDCQ